MSDSFVKDPLVVRYWCLCLMAALEAGGLAPAQRGRVHGLFYLTNALAPSYDDQPLVGVVMHHPRGPYFPEVDRHLARLSAQHLIHVTELHFFRDRQGSWIEAQYRITQSGAKTAEKLTAISLWKRRLEYLCDVAFGMARLADERVERAVRADDTYDRPGAANRDVYSFSAQEANYTVRRLSKLRAEVPHGLQHSRQDLVRTYATLLDLRVT